MSTATESSAVDAPTRRRSPIPFQLLVAAVICHLVLGVVGIPLLVINGVPPGETERTPWEVMRVVWAIGFVVVFPTIYMTLFASHIIKRIRR